MYRDENARARLIETHRDSHPDLLEAFTDEFLWNIEESEKALRGRGWGASWHPFSELCWGLELLPAAE